MFIMFIIKIISFFLFKVIMVALIFILINSIIAKNVKMNVNVIKKSISLISYYQ